MSLHHFVQSGIPNLYLSGGFIHKKTPYGDGISFLDMKGLLRAAAVARAQIDEPLSGPEVKFLRHELGLSQSKLGESLELNEQTIANWEKNKAFPKKRDSLAIQFLVLKKLAPTASIAHLASRPMPDQLTLSYSETFGWSAQGFGTDEAYRRPDAANGEVYIPAGQEYFLYYGSKTEARSDSDACESAAA